MASISDGIGNAGVVGNAVAQDQTSEWLSTSIGNIHAGLAQSSGADLPSTLVNVSAPTDPLCSFLANETARASICHSIKTHSRLPSLYQHSDATPTETSISTGLASQFSGVPLLEDVEGVLERRPNPIRQATYECPFWFLSCSYASSDKEEWKTHTLDHFRGEEPPQSVTCPLCDQFEYTCDNGWTSWNYRQEHVAYHHAILGESLRTSRPDFYLFQHLWQKRLIDEKDLKELNGGDYNLDWPPQYSVNVCAATKPIKCSEASTSRGNSPIEQPGPITDATNPVLEQEEDRHNLALSNEGPIHDDKQLDLNQEDIHSAAAFMFKSGRLSTCSESAQNLNCGSDDQQLDSDPNSKSESFCLHMCNEDDQESDCPSDDSQCDSDTVEGMKFDSTMECYLNGTIIKTIKNQYFTLLQQSFYANRRQSFYECTSGRGNSKGSDETRGGKRRATSPSGTDNISPESSKRSCGKRFNNKDRENEDGESQRKAPGGSPPGGGDNPRVKGRLFACPFVKRYPKRYFKCFSHTLKDISRVKQHLFRDKTHRLPIYCPNCSTIFDNELLRDEHIRDIQCIKMPAMKWEGVNESQRRQLSKRSPSARTPEANWFAIFEILFPGDPLPIDPYVDMALSGELRAFREHLLLEGSRIWHDVLTSQLPEHLRPYAEELQSLYDSLYVESIARMCESWHAQTSSEDTNETQTVLEGRSVSAGLRFANPKLTPGHLDNGHTVHPVVATSSKSPQELPLWPEHQLHMPGDQQVSDIPDNLDPISGLEEPLCFQDMADQSDGLGVADTRSRIPHPDLSSLETSHFESHRCDTSAPEIVSVETCQLGYFHGQNSDAELFYHQENPSFQAPPSDVSIQCPTTTKETPMNATDALNATNGTYPSIIESRTPSSSVPGMHFDFERAFPFLDFDVF